MLFASLFVSGLAVHASCNPVAVGSFQVYPNASLSPDGRFTFVYDAEAMAHSGGLNLIITNMETMQTARFATSAQVNIQGSASDLSQFLLVNAVGEHTQFSIVDKNGDLLGSFKLPDTNGQEEYVTKADYDGQLKRWLISTDRRLLSFSLVNSELKVIFDLQSKDQAFEWFNNFDNVNAFTYNSQGQILILTSHFNSVGQPASALRVFDGTTFSLVKQIEIATQGLPLQVDPDHLLFPQEIAPESAVTYVMLNVNSGELKRFPSDSSLKTTGNNLLAAGNLVQYEKTAFHGPHNTFAFITEDGNIKFYNVDLEVVQSLQIPNVSRWRKISAIAGQSGKIFLLHKDGVTPYYFDFESKDLTRFPQFMNFIFKSQSQPVKFNKIFTLLFDERLTKYSLFQYEMESQCLEDIKPISSSIDLKNLLLKKNMTAFAYAESFLPNLTTVFTAGVFSSFNEKEKQLWTLLVKDFLKNYLSIENSSSQEKSFQRIARWLNVFKPILVNLSPDEQDEVLDSIAISLSEKLSKDPQLSEVSISKLANIFIVNLKPYFGLQAEPRTDFVLLKDLIKDPTGKTIRPVILASSPIMMMDGPNDMINANRNDGIYIKKDLAPIVLNPGDEQKFQQKWLFEQQTWQAQGIAKSLSLNYLVNKSNSPRYDQLWSDKKLTGLVLMSPNLGEPLWLVRKYLNYFKDQGFDFGPSKIVWAKGKTLKGFLKENYLFPKNITETDDLKGWFAGLIQQGVLDYWIKEAHSGGNNDVIFVAKKNYVLKGVRSLPDGREENIYIAYTSGESFAKEDQISISNEEFAKWIQAREQNNPNQQLVYINASCWSSTKARQEIIAVRSPLLVEIATGDATLTFQNSVNNHLEVLLSSLRDSQDYDKIQSRLDAVKPADGTKNPYLLPNQKSYQKEIWNGLNSALDYTVTIEKD
ncbi:MAG: hypothetical protein ACXVCY_07855 [Pseudobdellovibrionaceae bacterium]